MEKALDEKRVELFDRIAATAIANQAILKCSFSGMPITVDNVILFVGDFIDPTDSTLDVLMEKIIQAIDEVIDCRERASLFTIKTKDH
jgi:hypothetical protein